jgi:hypothetical protein
MTIDISTGDEVPTDLLANAEDWLRDVAKNLAGAVQAIKAGQFAELKDATTSIRDLRLAVSMVNDERNRVEKFRKQVTGDIATGELDLDAARVEIGRRLACLRDAGGD